jgi:NADPH2:quinone reductase
MKAIRVHRPGNADALVLEDVPTPRPGPGEALVRVEAAGVNFIDVYIRSGAYPREPPIAMGEEGAGIVEALGEGVAGLAPGDRVAWASAAGSYATHVVARADRLVPIPGGVSARDAAAAMLQGMTAHYLAYSTPPRSLAPGDTCLVHAAAGGVGLLLVQMARRAGARVFGTTSTDAKAALVRAAGVEEGDVLRYDDFDGAVRAKTGGRGVDVVYDSVGATTFDRSLLALRPRGLLALFGQSSGRVPPLDLQVLNARGSLFVTRPTLAHYVATRPELLERAGAVLADVARGDLKLRIDRVFPLAQASGAHRALESRATSGKLVLEP